MGGQQVDFRLYVICDRTQIGDKTLPQFVQEALAGGVRAFQLREKDLAAAEQMRLAQEILPMIRAHGARLFINDRVDLARAVAADGVHLPASGLPTAVARGLCDAGQMLAVSCHTCDEVEQAEAEGADFAVFGPIYDTPSKRPFGPPLGLAALRQARAAVSFPLFAIGGINTTRLAEVFDAGADGVALISEIAHARNVRAQCQAFLDRIPRS